MIDWSNRELMTEHIRKMFHHQLEKNSTTVASVLKEINKKYNTTVISESTIRKLDRGETMASLTAVAVISNHFGLTIDEFIYGVNPGSGREAELEAELAEKNRTINNLNEYVELLKK